MTHGCEPLHFPAEGTGRRPRFWHNLTPRAKALVDQMASRGPVAPGVWGPDPERRRVATEIATMAAEEIGWPNAHFIPEDPFRLVLFNVYCDGCMVDNMEVETIILRIEELLGEMDDDLIGELYELTFGEAVDVLLGRTERARPLPVSGPGAPETRPCAKLAILLDIRRFLSNPDVGVSTRDIRPSSRIQRVIQPDTAWRLDSFVKRRFGVRTTLQAEREWWPIARLWITGTLVGSLGVLFFFAALGLVSPGSDMESVVFVPLLILATGLFATFIFAGLPYLLARTSERLRYGKRPRIHTFAQLARWIQSERARQSTCVTRESAPPGTS